MRDRRVVGWLVAGRKPENAKIWPAEHGLAGLLVAYAGGGWTPVDGATTGDLPDHFPLPPVTFPHVAA